ncbi:ATP-dependent DNA ligase [Empedobacter brevis]|uniref:ATP-dependent DNA ligase n=1 Tax=Empedobacter brevis TaxID=247 RepID=UPI0039B0D9CC
MRKFADLFDALDSTTKTNEKVEALISYFQKVNQEELLFSIALLIGLKPKRAFKTTHLREWCSEISEIPLWLIEDSYYVVGDLAETLALLIPTHHNQNKEKSLKNYFQELTAAKNWTIEEQKKYVLHNWNQLSGTDLFIFNKLITGNLRVGVSKTLVVRALAKLLNEETSTISHLIIGKWNPLEITFDSIFNKNAIESKAHLPYPFYLAYPVQDNFFEIEKIDDFILEKKLDGIRGQLIIREDEIYIWSRGEDILTDKFPEFEELKLQLPNGTVIDGEIIPWKDDAPLPFSIMQTRIGRKNVTKKYLEQAPLVMVCYDLLEDNGIDIRHKPLHERRKRLIEILSYINSPLLLLSEEIIFSDWNEALEFRNEARNHHAEGLMIKRSNSPYEVGRKKGNWYKWKSDPLSIDAVLLYAQSGSGRRSNLFTDYTFAVWQANQLVPFAKAYSGLTDAEINKVDRWVKRNTLEKFGPVRSVKPELVFEIAFEGIAKSTRHKSGVAVRFPRISRWREDKSVNEANTLEDLNDLLAKYGN